MVISNVLEARNWLPNLINPIAAYNPINLSMPMALTFAGRIP
jgi:hypothetical protein